MYVITSALGPFGLAAVVYMGLMLSTLSERLNAVAKRKDYHRWFQLANGHIAIAAISQMIRNAATLAPDRALPALLEPWFALVTFHLPLAMGTSILLLLVRYYWAWILKETSDSRSPK
jgi:hypothetical protein